jgi:butyrate kinase
VEKLLILNPGSTSTKIAVYEDENQLFVESISHSAEELSQYDCIADQYQFRKDVVMKTLEEHNVDAGSLTAIVSRGGLLPPVEAGAYEINEDMVWQLRYAPQNEHASNLGAIIAFEISKEQNIPSYIYDGVTVDEMIPLTKVAGLPGMRRKALGHNLNMRASAMKYAREHNKSYEDCSLAIAHLGGGITLSLHEKGRIIDFVSDEEGPFSPERTGGLPIFQLIDMAASGKYDKKAMMKIVKSKGGLMGYLGTTDVREVERMIGEGNEEARLVYEAMALSIAKHLAALSVVVDGKLDSIILTGGIAHSKMFTDMIIKRVSFIAPVTIYAGENEMQSLALGGLRVLRGQEKAKKFKKTES